MVEKNNIKRELYIEERKKILEGVLKRGKWREKGRKNGCFDAD